MVSSHDFLEDKRNKNVKIYVNGKFYHRDKAKISVFDSSALLGHGIWDSLRYHNKKFIFLKMHLDRLYKDAKLTDIKIPLNRKQISSLLHKTVKLNQMITDGHLRIIVSRGIKSTPYQSPKVTITKPSKVRNKEVFNGNIKTHSLTKRNSTVVCRNQREYNELYKLVENDI